MFNVPIEKLLESGVHFGHQKSRWNPNMKQYIFGVRSSIHMIDLRKTLLLLKESYEILRRYASQGSNILFVGTKKQIKDIIANEAQRGQVYWVSERWLGGMLTNFRTIRQSVQKLRQVERMIEDGTINQLTKKEANIVRKKREKLNRVLEGVRDMDRVPDIIFIVDISHEKTALAEAKKLGIPVIAIVDTNCDPTPIDHPIPGNDDAIKSVQLITSVLIDAVLEGKTGAFVTSTFAQAEKHEKVGKVVEISGDIIEEKTAEIRSTKGKTKPIKEEKHVTTKEKIPTKKEETIKKKKPSVKKEKISEKEEKPPSKAEQLPEKEEKPPSKVEQLPKKEEIIIAKENVTSKEIIIPKTKPKSEEKAETAPIAKKTKDKIDKKPEDKTEKKKTEESKPK